MNLTGQIRPWNVPYAERFANRKPSVFIGVPAFGDIYAEVFESWVAWSMNAGKQYADKFIIYFHVVRKREQYRARNLIVYAARQMNADFLLTVDDDHVLSDCMDMIGAFYRAEKPFQGPLCMQRRTDKVQPIVQHYDPSTESFLWVEQKEIPTESCFVDVVGGGIGWYDMSIFNHMGDRHTNDIQSVWFRTYDGKMGCDMRFCLDVRRLGIRPWMNLDVQTGHVAVEREIVRPPSLIENQLCQQCGKILSAGQSCDCHRLAAPDFAARERFRVGYPQLADTICRAVDFSTVLDVGSGQGFLVDEMIARGKSVTGIEREDEAVAFMSPAAKDAIRIGDATNGGCPDDRFDLVTCVEVAEHVEPERTAGLLDALARTTKDWLFFTADDTPSRLHINLHSQQWWRDALTCRGFTFDDQKTGAVRQALQDNPLPWLAKNAMIFSKEDSNG